MQKLISNYLTDRNQYVELENFKPNTLTIKTGVLQGSILDSLIFLIYINDLCNSSQVFDIISSADNTILLVNIDIPSTPSQ